MTLSTKGYLLIFILQIIWLLVTLLNYGFICFISSVYCPGKTGYSFWSLVNHSLINGNYQTLKIHSYLSCRGQDNFKEQKGLMCNSII